MSCALSAWDIIGWAVFTGLIALIIVGIIGCVKENQQAGDYDGR